MKAILKIVWFYLNFQRLMTWMLYFGLFIVFIVMPVAAYKAGPPAAFACAMLAYVMVFVFSFIASPWAFRILISNQRFSLIPNFNRNAGIGLFLLLILSIGNFVLISYFLNAPNNKLTLLSIMNIFSFASVYIGIIQLCASHRWMGIAMAYLPIFFMLTLKFYSDLLLNLIFYPPVTSIIFFSSLLVWAYGFYILATQSHFKALSLNNSAWGCNSHRNNGGDFSWFGKFTIKGTHSNSDSILFGFLDGRSSKISRCILMAVILPLFWIFIIFVIEMQASDRGPMNLWFVFLSASLLMISISGLTNGEIAARARYLWLKTSGDRKSLWPYIDKPILEMLVIYLAITIILSAAFFIFSPLSLRVILNYPVIALCCYLYLSYFLIAARANQWPGFATLLVFSITIGIIITFFVKMTPADSSLLYNALEVFLIMLGLSFRYYAKRNFKHINWMEVKPLIKGRLSIQT